MLLFTVAAVASQVAVLHVAVHRDAGTIHDVAADGAAGQCTVQSPTHLVCPAPAGEPVRFRWGATDPWVLSGETEVRGGETGAAFVLAPDGTYDAILEGLEDPTLDAVRDVYLRTGANPLQPPSRRLVERLIELCAHPDFRIRQVATRSLMPYVRHTSADPFPPGSPSLLPPGLLAGLARDPHAKVRRSAARVMRELSREDPHRQERHEAVTVMKQDSNRGVRRLATVLERQVALEGEEEALEAWNGAMRRVTKPGAPGRAAANSLALLEGEVDPEQIDVEGALARVLRYHPERGWRVWAAWRDTLPFDAGSAEFLLRETVGLSQPLLRHWAEHEPDRFADLLERWEPVEPHSERWRVIAAWVDPRAEHPRLRQVLGLPDRLSDPPEAGVPQ